MDQAFITVITRGGLSGVVVCLRVVEPNEYWKLKRFDIDTPKIWLFRQRMGRTRESSHESANDDAAGVMLLLRGRLIKTKAFRSPTVLGPQSHNQQEKLFQAALTLHLTGPNLCSQLL
jgi:hypothetical protein